MGAPNSNIHAAFRARLLAYTGVPSVAWEGLPFTPTAGAIYLKPALLPGEPRQAEIGPNGQNWHTGVFQISIMAPAGVGVAAISTLRDGLIDWFKRGTSLVYSTTTVTCTKAYGGPVMPETDRLHLPITIQYRVLAPN